MSREPFEWQREPARKVALKFGSEAEAEAFAEQWVKELSKDHSKLGIYVGNTVLDWLVKRRKERSHE